MWSFPAFGLSKLFGKAARRSYTTVEESGWAVSDSGLRLTAAHDPDPAELMFIERSLVQYNIERVGPSLYRRLAVFIRGPSGNVLGGITGSTYWGWLMIDLFWLPEDLRGKGYGQELLTTMEREASGRGCHHACLDTFTFQGAIGFYEKCGYARLGVLPSFPFGHERLYLVKELRGD